MARESNSPRSSADSRAIAGKSAVGSISRRSDRELLSRLRERRPPYQLLIDSAGACFLPTEVGFPLGIRDGSYAKREVELAARRRHLLLGRPFEATSQTEEEYGTERIRHHFHAESATVESLLDDVNAFVSGAPPAGDQTVLLIRASG